MSVGYYSAKDISQILQVKQTKAYEILKMFEAKGQLFQDGGTRRVRKSYFETWLEEQEAPPMKKVKRRGNGRLKYHEIYVA